MKGSLILVTTSLAAFLTPFISSSITFLVPRIGESLSLSFYQAAVLPLIILIPLASFMLLFGRLSDLMGRVLLFRFGLIIFTGGSLASFFSKNYNILVTSLFILGMGSSIISANSTAIVSSKFVRNRGFALGINAMSVYLGLTMAPFLSGIMAQYLTWESIFLLVLPVSTISLLISFFTLRREITGGKRIAITGSAFLAVSLVSISLYLSFGYIYGFLRLLPILYISLAFFLIFSIEESMSRNPLISFEMMKARRTFLASNAAAALNYIATFSIVFVFSIYLQVTLHVSPFLSGLYILPEPVLMVLMSPISGRISDRISSRWIASIGMIIIGLSFLVFFLLIAPSTIEILLILAFLGVGFGMFSAPNTNSVMGSIKTEFSGFASGFLGTMRFVGQLLSILVATTVFSITIPRDIMIGIFSGIYVSIGESYFQSFLHGFREIMFISSLISFAGAVASLMR
ncbi:MAG: MFS transporter [Thermoplasmatales archaeon]